MIAGVDRPAARAASMNSFCFSDRVWPRTMRDMVSHSTAPMARKIRIGPPLEGTAPSTPPTAGPQRWAATVTMPIISTGRITLRKKSSMAAQG